MGGDYAFVAAWLSACRFRRECCDDGLGSGSGRQRGFPRQLEGQSRSRGKSSRHGAGKNHGHAAPGFFPPISEQFASKWQASDVFKKLCAKATQGIAGLLSCNVPNSGELRARLSGQNLDLKYIVSGISLRGRINVPDPLPGSLDAVFRVRLDVEIRMQVTFDTRVDGRIIPPGVEQATVATALDAGAPYLVKPIHAGTIQVQAINQQVTAEGTLIDIANFLGRDIRKEVTDRMTNFIKQQNPEIQEFDFSEQNRSLHRGANLIASIIRQRTRDSVFKAGSFRSSPSSMATASFCNTSGWELRPRYCRVAVALRNAALRSAAVVGPRESSRRRITYFCSG